VAPGRVVPLLIGATVGEIERELVLQTLARCDGNRTHAARVLGVSVRTLRNKIRQYSAEGADVPAHH
jgi:DNA-binding NtrC family response regulator